MNLQYKTTFIIFRIMNKLITKPSSIKEFKNYSDSLIDDDFIVKSNLQVNFKLFPNLTKLNISKLSTSPFSSYKLFLEPINKYYMCINSPIYLKTFDTLNDFNTVQSYILNNKNIIFTDIMINSIILKRNNISLIHMYYSDENGKTFLCLPVNGFIEDFPIYNP